MNENDLMEMENYRDERLERSQRRYERLKKNPNYNVLCVQCGEELEEGEWELCADCREEFEKENDNYNYDKDTWDAMTDGNYGDFPGGDIDFDFFGRG